MFPSFLHSFKNGGKKDFEGFLYDFKWGKYLGQEQKRGFVAEKWEMFPSAPIKP